MNNNIITSLVTMDNIKDYFYLYYWIGDVKYGNGLGRIFDDFPCIEYNYTSKKRWGSIKKPVLNNKFQYILQNQISKLEKYDLNGNDIIKFIATKILDNEIPKRYNYTETIIYNAILDKVKIHNGHKVLKFPYHYNQNFGLYKFTFSVKLISLLEQKFSCSKSKKIVGLFKELNEHDGLEFDEYIDNWAKRLLQKKTMEE